MREAFNAMKLVPTLLLVDAFRPYVSENEGDTGGLGLYICKNMIEAMNGELRYERKEGKSYFFISLRQA